MKTPIVFSLISLSLITAAQATSGFYEDFKDATLDPVDMTLSAVSGSLDHSGSGYYVVTDSAADGDDTVLSISGGTLASLAPDGSYVFQLDFEASDFFGVGSGNVRFSHVGTQGHTDLEVKQNGDLRLFSLGGTISTTVAITGAADNTPISLIETYDEAAKTVSWGYTVGAASYVEILVHVFGNEWNPATDNMVSGWGNVKVNVDGSTTPVVVKLDTWSLTPVPEPSAAALTAGCVGLTAVMVRRRR